jgi:ubiquitin carboxyl-terminal hydrolase 14
MNATVQALRAIPELQTALHAAATGAGVSLPGTLRDLYAQMGRTTEPVIPLAFLQALRAAAPQFAEVDRARAGKGSGPSAGLPGAAALLGGGGGYAQQDAEECWGAILQGLRDVPGVGTGAGTFVDQHMLCEFKHEWVDVSRL